MKFPVVVLLVLVVYHLMLRQNGFAEKEILDALQTKSMGLLRTGGSIGFVLAHPDDESMFFMPTIKFVKRVLQSRADLSQNIYILTLTNGNFKGQGNVRELEFREVCQKYGFRCSVLNVPEFQDGSEKWDAVVVKGYILNFIKDNGISLIFTFDEFGVSKHPNHISASESVRVVKEDFPSLNVWFLSSLSLFNKYSSVVSMLNFLFSENCIILPSPLDVYKNMKLYKSQLQWYHPFWALFSSYSYINIFRKFDPHNIEL